MKKFMLNNLGYDWVFDGVTVDDAEKKFLSQSGFKSLEDYQQYCLSIDVNPDLWWEEV